VVADTLSRRPLASAISVVRNPLGELVKSHLEEDPVFGKIFVELTGEVSEEVMERLKDYRVSDGVLYFRGRLCIPEVRDIRESILRDCHEIPIAGHPGFEKTYRTVRKSYYWSGIKKMVRDFVLGCGAC
jgi:hypothetical protein